MQGIARCLTPLRLSYSSAELHTFCDASLRGYATVIYIRFVCDNAPPHVALVCAKSRVTPLKPLSIPRLELQAALLGARLTIYTLTELEIKISKKYFWSDSRTVLRWIVSEPRTKQIYVAHRLGEVGEITESSD